MWDLFFSPHVCSSDCPPQKCNGGKAEPGRFERIRKARSICAVCPVVEECLEYALERREVYGIWGGKTERERQRIRKQRRMT